MYPKHISILRCPKTERPLVLRNEQLSNGRIKEGDLLEPISGNQYPIINFIPRFVPLENYAVGFGFQWNTHLRTQYDETSRFNMSGERFEKETKWEKNLAGQMILEVGSGSGRFTTEALKTGAMVVSFDYSSAVEANYKSNGNSENVLIIQASVYEIPLQKNFFDKAFCIGVLQHTPDPERSFFNVLNYLKPGGNIVSDVYLKNFQRYFLETKYWVRPFTKKIPPQILYNKIKKYIDFMWPLVKRVRKIPKIGSTLCWKLLIPDYSKEMPGAGENLLKEWAYLDSMDMLSPMYDKPQTLKSYKQWHRKANLMDIDVHYGYNGIEGRGTKR